MHRGRYVKLYIATRCGLSLRPAADVHEDGISTASTFKVRGAARLHRAASVAPQCWAALSLAYDELTYLGCGLFNVISVNELAVRKVSQDRALDIATNCDGKYLLILAKSDT